MQSKNNEGVFLDSRKPFLEHLEDLRATFIRIIIAIALASLISFFFASQLLSILKHPLVVMLHAVGSSHLEKEILRSLNPAGAVMLSLKISLFAGIMVALPFLLYFLAQFILPGLTGKEKKYLLPIFLWGSILFAAGALFCYGVALPQTLRFLWSYNESMGITPFWTIENYIPFALFLIIAFGLAFETPLLILTLVKLDILSPEQLRTKRRYAIVAIFIVAAVLTPPDVFSQVILAVPMLLLYEVCVWISRWGKRA